MSKVYECDTLGYCPFEDQFNSSGASCREHCGLGVDEDAPEDWEDEEDLGLFPFDEEDDEDLGFDGFEPEIDESMNPYDGTYDWENDVTDIGD